MVSTAPTSTTSIAFNRISPVSYKMNCIRCDKTLEKQQKLFCSISCSAITNNKKRGRNTVRCLNCNLVFEGKKTKKFCNRTCSTTYSLGRTVRAWLNDQASVTRVTAAIRKYLISLRGNKCEECGWNKVHPVTKLIPLEIDHVDGDSENNLLSNLKVLCPNCHSLTPTFRALNKGKSKRKR